ncbi:MAG TPA: hydantoinase/oxoprolinase family protein [Gammaproteobacteria bacterium]|jgi:N-methylhydantoinase A|nr:hydantoinase/oxoprolinase family protein [Gammaproteobacteria bacterium]HIO03647.1 hydantoinase/oxoprolinase family protein [Alphaproteobacteria bacterium]HIA41117.1 hydantoinase/oxoprolinase family protein [Gammaproteobacteria bacterium]HIB08051.1 hydantoinase/oxoprolinase family protein [Gammaproteobacteria bacterium]HIB81902.1 hydantoinase/oxoprolinase family protein [Gammaproteobacteria bacterium]
MRFACDTGGTFTDLIVENSDGTLSMYKAPTTPEDPILGVLQSLELASEDQNISLSKLLSSGEMFIHGTTHATNAIVTQSTAKTALLTTAGHPDILVLREGGRIEPFNFLVPYPAPYVPRALTYEIPERIDSLGNIVTPLEDRAVLAAIEELKRQDIEAVAVCFLWSITNSVHEQRVGQLLSENLPDVPYSLSHVLNPTLREYRRASATAIDASLKPLMTKYMGSLTQRLAEAGFNGRTLVLTSQGGMIDAEELATQPIHAINSGPSMAPIAGRHYAQKEVSEPNAIIADTGGTTYDVSLVHRGRIPRTRETWIGQQFRGHMTGFPSIDIKSVGAGGGSIACVDQGGILRVGPQSAGAVPGPVCYNIGGTEPTLTDAALVLGYLDAEFFLGGALKLHLESARSVIKNKVAGPLGFGIPEAAAAIVSVVTENMVQAISEITVNQGIDPADAVLIGGGGAAGLNSTWIARRLGCPSVLIPETGAGLSAYGAMISELSREYRTMFFTTSANWDEDGVNKVLGQLRNRCQAFVDGPGAGAIESSIEFSVEARYAGQVWEIEVPLATTNFEDPADLSRLIKDFHATHQEIFAINDPDSIVEMVGWTSSVSCRLRKNIGSRLREIEAKSITKSREIYFDGAEVTTPVYPLQSIPVSLATEGPAIIETPFTTIVIDPAARFYRSEHGSVMIMP